MRFWLCWVLVGFCSGLYLIWWWLGFGLVGLARVGFGYGGVWFGMGLVVVGFGYGLVWLGLGLIKVGFGIGLVWLWLGLVITGFDCG